MSFPKALKRGLAMHPLNRRDFVTAASIACAGFPVGAGAARQASKPYRACMIGHTGRGGYGHLDMSFQKVRNVTLVGVADPNEKGRLNAARRYGASRSYADYQEMIAKERPNLVAICPYFVENRLEMTQAAAEVGAHI